MSGRHSRSTERSIINTLRGRDLCVEVKVRAHGFRELYYWLNQRDVLLVNRREPLVVVRLPPGCRNYQAGCVNMPRRPAQITQAEVALIICAAKQAGAPSVAGGVT
jgi:hypothetical protein